MAAGHGEKLTRKQEQAIAALLSEPTLEAAAGTAGISVRTLKTWLTLDDFRRAFDAARRQVLSDTVSRLAFAGTQAVDLREQLRTALRSAARWRALACVLGLALALSLAAGAAGGLSLAYSWTKQREAQERERQREADELRALQETRDRLEELDRRLSGARDFPDVQEARDRLRRSREEVRRQDALAPVAGGLGAAALPDPGD
jgi:hypothetical protein